MTSAKTAIPVDQEAIARFCQTWRIKEFALFGSVLTDEFREDSDVDVLVTFEDPTRWSLFDVVDRKDELERLFGRKVDVVEKAFRLSAESLVTVAGASAWIRCTVPSAAYSKE